MSGETVDLQQQTEQAKQGNPKAIAALINQSLKRKEITASVALKGNCLQILIKSTKSLGTSYKQGIADSIKRGMTNLKPQGIETVKVYVQQPGELVPSWSEEIQLVEPAPEPEPPAPVEQPKVEPTLMEKIRAASLESKQAAKPANKTLSVIVHLILFGMLGGLAYCFYWAAGGRIVIPSAAEPAPSPVPIAQAKPAAPTPAPSPPKPAAARGLGVLRSDIQNPFQFYGFKFQNGTPVKGQPRVMGRSPEGAAAVEIIGPPNNPQQATIIAMMPSDNEGIQNRNATYIKELLRNTMPKWQGYEVWLESSADQLSKGAPKVTADHQGKLIELSNLSIGGVMLVIKPSS